LPAVGAQITLVAKHGADTLGTASIVLLVAFGSANSGISALFDALNVVYNEREKRSFLRFYAITATPEPQLGFPDPKPDQA
jgi:membrane protein